MLLSEHALLNLPLCLVFSFLNCGLLVDAVIVVANKGFETVGSCQFPCLESLFVSLILIHRFFFFVFDKVLNLEVSIFNGISSFLGPVVTDYGCDLIHKVVFVVIKFHVSAGTCGVVCLSPVHLFLDPLHSILLTSLQSLVDLSL